MHRGANRQVETQRIARKYPARQHQEQERRRQRAAQQISSGLSLIPL